eukprot:7918812-Pyramimonas_sp.AAC.1
MAGLIAIPIVNPTLTHSLSHTPNARGQQQSMQCYTCQGTEGTDDYSHSSYGWRLKEKCIANSDNVSYRRRTARGQLQCGSNPRFSHANVSSIHVLSGLVSD